MRFVKVIVHIYSKLDFPPFNAWSVHCFHAGKIFYGLLRMALLLLLSLVISAQAFTLGKIILGFWAFLALIEFFQIRFRENLKKNSKFFSPYDTTCHHLCFIILLSY